MVNSTPDSMKIVSNDSISSGVYDNDNGTPDGMVIKKDEMLGQKIFAVKPVADDVSDTAKKASSISLLVEFWKSPLNYHGYKYSKNKMVLFGIESGDVEGIYHTDNFTYIKAANSVYRIELTNDFHSFERISDPSIIGSLK